MRSTSATLPSRRQIVDRVVAGVLVVAHAVLAAVTTLWVGLSVMGLDPCAYVACGDERWAHIGVATGMIGGLILLLADIGAVCVRIAALKPAWFIPVVMCVAQGLLTAGALQIVSWAGPQ